MSRELSPAGALALLVLLAFAAPAGAQISPGPLSKAHEELEGVKNCLKCHGLGEKEVDSHCLQCHTEISYLRAEGRGFHARKGAGACADCHLEHGGEDFELVDWGRGGPGAFDHAEAGWPLTGKHTELDCAKCHEASLRKSAVMLRRPDGAGGETWLGLETDCASCHRDPHENRFGADCASCHVTADFHTIVEASFDHDRTRYPLRGKHSTVACTSCHPSGFEALPAFGTCGSCHQDPHRGEATLAGAVVDCAECHRVEGFRPSTFGVKRHAGARWPLEGKHAAVACAGCHGGPGADALRIRLAFGACTDCHEDAHAGQLASVQGGRCDACHDSQGFRPARYDAERHAAVWPLEGAHADAACRTCHGPDRPADLSGPEGAVRPGSAGAVFRVPRTCAACHVDPHRTRFGATNEDCLRCHDPRSFSPSAVDAGAHASFDFALEGAHAAVPCFLCHRDLQSARPPSTLVGDADRWPDLELRAAHETCSDCHDDPHGGQFASRADGGSCAACHDARAFRPASNFRHDDARFPLQGAHAKVACGKCHESGPRADGTPGPVYRPLRFACEDCHATPVGETP